MSLKDQNKLTGKVKAMLGTRSSVLSLTAAISLIILIASNTAGAVLPIAHADNPAPNITNISPNSGDVNGGTEVTITGTDFLSGVVVSIGGLAAIAPTVISPTMIVARTPLHTSGAVDVVVTNPDSQFSTLTDGFTYTGSFAGTEGTLQVLCPPNGDITVQTPQAVDFEERSVNFANQEDAFVLPMSHINDDISRIRIIDTRGYDDSGQNECGLGFTFSVQSDGLKYTSASEGIDYNLQVGIGTLDNSLLVEDQSIVSSTPEVLVGNIIHAATASSDHLIGTAMNLLTADTSFNGSIDFQLSQILKTVHSAIEKAPTGSPFVGTYDGAIPATQYSGVITFTVTPV